MSRISTRTMVNIVQPAVYLTSLSTKLGTDSQLLCGTSRNSVPAA